METQSGTDVPVLSHVGVMDFYMGPVSYEGPTLCAWHSPRNCDGKPKADPSDLCDLIDFVAHDDWIADLVSDAICYAPALGDIKIAAQHGKTSGEYFEKVALIENEARDSKIDLATTRKVIDRLLAEAQALLKIDHVAVMTQYHQATDRLMGKLNTPLPADIQRELDAIFQTKAKPSKPKDDRPAVYRVIDKAVTDMPREISGLALNTTCNQIVDRSDFDANAQAYLITQIALNAHMGKHAARAAVKESIDSMCEKNRSKKKTEGNITNQDNHKDQVAYARDSHKKAHETEPTMFRYGTENGKIEHVPEEGTTSVKILNKDGLRAETNRVTNFVTIKENGDVKGVSTPVDVVSDLLQEQLPIPYLRGVSAYPQFDADGKFLATNGYHPSPYLFIQLPEDLVIPAVSAVPTDEEVHDALHLLILEWLADFPFDGYSRRDILLACGLEEPMANEVVKPVPPSLANFLAFVLQPLVRPIIGNHPMPATLITKPESGTGASLLVSLVQLLITGKPSVRPPFPSDQDEQRKEVLTALRGGDPFINLDNVVGNMDSPVLAALLTAVNFTGRILGRTEEVSVPNTASTIITGNNPKFTGELQRRISLVRLDAGVAKPGKRGDWHLEDIENWTEKNRGKLLAALATLVMHWQAEKRQNPEAAPLASYRDWHNVCGGIVEACGLKSFQSNRDQIEQVAGNDEDDPMREFVFKWYEVATKPSTDLELAGVFAKELSSLADAYEIDLPVKRHVVDGERLYNPNAFGRYLGQQSQRVFAVDGVNLRIEPSEKTKSGKPWGLVVVPDGG